MTKFYSPTENGFYDRDIHGNDIPSDAIEISDEKWRSMLRDMSSGTLYQLSSSGELEAYDGLITTEAGVSVEIRSQRDSLLASTDYYLMEDYPISENNLDYLKVYRQLLRDITLQDGFPLNVIWPQLPDFVKNESS